MIDADLSLIPKTGGRQPAPQRDTTQTFIRLAAIWSDNPKVVKPEPITTFGGLMASLRAQLRKLRHPAR